MFCWCRIVLVLGVVVATTECASPSRPVTNVAHGIIPTASSAFTTAYGGAAASVVTDGSYAPRSFAETDGGLQWIKFDLGASYPLNRVKLWHYYADGRSYHDVIVQLSNDVNFASGVTTVFNNDTDNSAGQGKGSQSEYAETPAGKDISFSPVTARYVRTWTNGSTANQGNHYVEVEAYGIRVPVR